MECLNQTQHPNVAGNIAPNSPTGQGPSILVGVLGFGVVSFSALTVYQTMQACLGGYNADDRAFLWNRARSNFKCCLATALPLAILIANTTTNEASGS